MYSHCYYQSASNSNRGFVFRDSLSPKESFGPLHQGVTFGCNFHCVDLNLGWIAFRLSLLMGGQLLLGFGSKATTWWSLYLCGCSWGCSVLSWILLFDWLNGLIRVFVYCCPIEVWYVTSWNTLLAESPLFA